MLSPQENTVMRRTSCGVLLLQIQAHAKDRNILLNKPNQCISLRRSMLRSSLIYKFDLYRTPQDRIASQVNAFA